MNAHHKEILQQIKNRSGTATQHTFLETYLGNKHPKYAISSPVLRDIAKNWMKSHKEITGSELATLLTSLFEGKSFTEKILGGIMMDYFNDDQRKIKITFFDHWLDQLEGWAEIDALCTGKFALKEVPAHFDNWAPFLRKLRKSKNIGKRRASLVFLCSPISHSPDKNLADLALENIEHLKHEEEGLITKAISWLLRSMIRHHRETVEHYIRENRASLPAVAVRETNIKLQTGKKGGLRN